jgi:UDP-N-acetyl-D-mannosaminuronate dehydrogenase
MNVGIIGFGEIGRALSKVYKEKNYEVKIVDINLNIHDEMKEIEILNICIPYNNKFIESVNKYVDMYKPKLTVIHSTVAPGTTKQINGLCCHSPVRGTHPNLEDGIKKFIKYIGSDSIEAKSIYAQHLKSLNIPYFICKNSETSEYAKLIDTTYYGICIAFHSEVKKLCDKRGLEFDEVMTNYNNSYNETYRLLGKDNVIRPVLYPTSKIGGHCVIPNAEILKNFMPSKLIDGVLDYK